MGGFTANADHGRRDRHRASSSGRACCTGATGSRPCAGRRSSCYGIIGGGVLVAAGLVVNHAGGLPLVVAHRAASSSRPGRPVRAGRRHAAALGLLADISERFPADRGAIMGLYSVFLAIGQITGALIGGFAADWRGIDGMLIATAGLLVVALIPLARLRSQEHQLDAGGIGPVAGGTTSTASDDMTNGRPWAPVPLARGTPRGGRRAAPPRDRGRACPSCAPAAAPWTRRSPRTRSSASSCPAAAGSAATRSG